MLWGGCYDLYGFRWVLAKWFNAKRSLTLHTSTKRKIKKKQTMALIIIAATTQMMNWFQRNCQQILRFNQPHANTHYTFVINFFSLFSLLFFSFYFFFLNTHTVFTYDSQFLTCVALFRFFSLIFSIRFIMFSSLIVYSVFLLHLFIHWL